MALNPLTRASKGSALSHAEMDSNLTLLAQDSTDSQQGNIEIATQAEANSLTSTSLALTPGRLTNPVLQIIDANPNRAAVLATPGYFWDQATGFIVLWGEVTPPTNGWATVSLPTTVTSLFNATASAEGDGTSIILGGSNQTGVNINGTILRVFNPASPALTYHWIVMGQK